MFGFFESEEFFCKLFFNKINPACPSRKGREKRSGRDRVCPWFQGSGTPPPSSLSMISHTCTLGCTFVCFQGAPFQECRRVFFCVNILRFYVNSAWTWSFWWALPPVGRKVGESDILADLLGFFDVTDVFLCLFVT